MISAVIVGRRAWPLVVTEEIVEIVHQHVLLVFFFSHMVNIFIRFSHSGCAKVFRVLICHTDTNMFSHDNLIEVPLHTFPKHLSFESYGCKGVNPGGWGGHAPPPIFRLGGRISNCPPPPIFSLCSMKFNSTLFSVYCGYCLSLSILLNIIQIQTRSHMLIQSCFFSNFLRCY